MKVNLVLVLPTAGDGPVDWALVTDAGDVQDQGRVDQGQTLSSQAGRAQRVIAIAPGADVALHQAPSTKGSDANARAAALFAIEDDIAMDLDDVHLALGPRTEASTRPAVVVTKHIMTVWRDLLSDLDVSPDVMTPDFMAMTLPEDGAVIVDTGEGVLINTGQAGLTIEPELVAAVAPPLFEGQTWSTIQVLSDRAEQLGLSTLRAYGPVDLQPTPSRLAFFSACAKGALQPGQVNLLQGAFARRGEVRFGLAGWRRAGVLGAITAIAALGLTLAETIAYRSAAHEARAEAQQIVSRLLPDQGGVRDPAALMRARVNAGQGGGPGLFLTLNAVLFDALQTSPTVELEGVRFDQQDGALIASLVFDSYADLEALGAQLEAAGAVVEDRGARSAGGRQSGDLELRSGR